jgi:hypothetical protein
MTAISRRPTLKASNRFPLILAALGGRQAAKFS